jgi:hypothetical protein
MRRRQALAPYRVIDEEELLGARPAARPPSPVAAVVSAPRRMRRPLAMLAVAAVALLAALLVAGAPAAPSPSHRQAPPVLRATPPARRLAAPTVRTRAARGSRPRRPARSARPMTRGHVWRDFHRAARRRPHRGVRRRGPPAPAAGGMPDGQAAPATVPVHAAGGTVSEFGFER